MLKLSITSKFVVRQIPLSERYLMHHGPAPLHNPTITLMLACAMLTSTKVSAKGVGNVGTNQSPLSVMLHMVKRCPKLSDLNLQRVNHVKV